ncbi:MAG: YciI family protein [Pseudomonadota bacterium]
MQYLLMIYSDEAAEARMSEAETQAEMAAYGAYAGAMAQAGVLAGGERLRPTADATSVRIRNGKTELLNGPYADTREQLGGYFMVEVPDLDAALLWAARCPSASHGTIEVRPVWPM